MMQGLVDRMKGFFQPKDRVDEGTLQTKLKSSVRILPVTCCAGGLRLLLDQNEGEIGPLALYSPSPSLIELGVNEDPHKSRHSIIISCCLSIVW